MNGHRKAVIDVLLAEHMDRQLMIVAFWRNPQRQSVGVLKIARFGDGRDRVHRCYIVRISSIGPSATTSYNVVYEAYQSGRVTQD